MRRLLAGAAVAVAVTAIGVVAVSGARRARAAAGEPPPVTASVERGRVSDTVSQYGVLTYRARPDGSPYAVINRARGTYTKLPDSGAEIACGDVLYRVNNHPVLLLCGSTPAYRTLSEGDTGPDVGELNASLVLLGYATRARLEPSDRFSTETAAALGKLQSTLGERRTGTLALGQAVVLPERVRVARVAGELGAIAERGAHVLYATSDTLEVQIALDSSQQGEVKEGDGALITLPGNRSVRGRVDRLGRVAQGPAGHDNPGGATIPAFIRLDRPARARRLDRAPVQVEIATEGVASALSVPVTAIVGKAGGGFAVEVVRDGGRRDLVPVKLGLFDTAGGRVQVEGAVRAGDRVVVPSS